jgi:hypothetical protein
MVSAYLVLSSYDYTYLKPRIARSDAELRARRRNIGM